MRPSRYGVQTFNRRCRNRVEFPPSRYDFPVTDRKYEGHEMGRTMHHYLIFETSSDGDVPSISQSLPAQERGSPSMMRRAPDGLRYCARADPSE